MTTISIPAPPASVANISVSVTIQSPGSNDTINGAVGNETIYLGSGTVNIYIGAVHPTNVCRLPAPPSSWHDTTGAYYHDTLTNCTLVSP